MTLNPISKNNQKIIISKFGGTSMGDADCMLRSAQVSCQQNSYLTVVSATSGTTNLLIEIGKTAQTGNWQATDSLIEKIKTKHLTILNDLKNRLFAVTTKTNELLKTVESVTELNNKQIEELFSLAKGICLLKDCSEKAMDSLMSLGERLSSNLFVIALQIKILENHLNFFPILIDARQVLKTDEQYGKAKPLFEQTLLESKLIQEKFPFQNYKLITQGFIGSTLQNHTTTLGRGGSDYSAALFAESFNAHELEIWTDVAGIATTDPRICSEAKPIAEISFKEASELATFGAKVLHPATLAPAMRKNIPVFVGSSFDPNAKGTWVRAEAQTHPLVRALALRKNQVLLTLSTPDMLHTHGFLFQIFKVFNDLKISIDAITTSEISVSLTLDDSTLLNKTLIEKLSQFADVQVEEKLSLISLIGNNINHTAGLAEKIFKAIGDINVRMICLGASKHNFCFLVEEAKGHEVINRLHKSFELGH